MQAWSCGEKTIFCLGRELWYNEEEKHEVSFLKNMGRCLWRESEI